MAVCVILAAALVLRLKRGGAPYFTPPGTIIDHVGPKEHPIRKTLAALAHFNPMIPKAASVAVLHGRSDRATEESDYFTATSILPERNVVASRRIVSGPKPDFIVAVDGQLDDDTYAVIARSCGAALYGRRR